MGLVAMVYAAIGGLIIGIVLAVLIGLWRKSKNKACDIPETPYLIRFRIPLRSWTSNLLPESG